MSYQTLFFIFLIIITIPIADSFAVKSGGYTTVPVSVIPGEIHMESWYLKTEKAGTYTITATGNGTKFADIPNEIELKKGGHSYPFEITLPKTVTSGLYIVDLHIVQKEVEANTGGNVMIEAAKKIWKITPKIEQQEPVEKVSPTVKEAPKEDPPAKITPEKIEVSKTEKEPEPKDTVIELREEIKVAETVKHESVEPKEDTWTAAHYMKGAEPPPLKQLKDGVLPHEVKCKEGLKPHIVHYKEVHLTHDKVICVTDKTLEVLKARGWLFVN